MVRNLFLSGTNGQSLLFIDDRLKNRETFCEWNKSLMGPIRDSRGVEQGGVNSDNFYKMVNNEQVQTSQDSELGVTIGDITVSCVAQADDVCRQEQTPGFPTKILLRPLTVL